MTATTRPGARARCRVGLAALALACVAGPLGALASDPALDALAGAGASWREADGRVRTLYRPRFVPANELLAGARLLEFGPVDLQFDSARARLLLTGAQPRVADTLEALRYLDVASPEVLVDVAVVETSCRRRRESGGHTLFDQSAGGPDTFFRSFRHDFEPEAWLRSQLIGERPFEGTSVAFKDGDGRGTYAGTIEAVLRGLAHDGSSDLVSRPSLVLSEGVPARIESTIALPVTLFESAPPWAGTGDRRFYVAERTGVSLEVTAEFVGSDGVRLRLHPWIRRISAADAGDGPVGSPRFALSELTSTIRVADGETVVVGGLEGRRRVRDRDGLPLLDRLPALDGALSARLEEDESTDLQMLVRARILTPGRGSPRFSPPGERERLARRAAGPASLASAPALPVGPAPARPAAAQALPTRLPK